MHVSATELNLQFNKISDRGQGPRGGVCRGRDAEARETRPQYNQIGDEGAGGGGWEGRAAEAQGTGGFLRRQRTRGRRPRPRRCIRRSPCVDGPDDRRQAGLHRQVLGHVARRSFAVQMFDMVERVNGRGGEREVVDYHPKVANDRRQAGLRARSGLGRSRRAGRACPCSSRRRS